MQAADAFPFVWLGGVALMGIVSLFWAINDLKMGSARVRWSNTRVSREEEPFDFWIAVGGKLLAVPMTAFMFWLGLEMLRW